MTTRRCTPVILDHDGGVDDLVALSMLASSRTDSSLELIGCVVVDADCFADVAAECCLRLLNLIGQAAGSSLRPVVPIAVSSFAAPVEPFPNDWRKDCINMLDLPVLNTPTVVALAQEQRYARRIKDESGEALMARLVLNSDDPVVICVTGPLSNVAWCLRKYGCAFASKIEKIILMGGAIAVQGNVFSAGRDGSAEWNIYWDCCAAQEVLASPLLEPHQRILFPLDVTNHVPVTSSFVRQFGSVTTGAGAAGGENAGPPPSTLASFMGSAFAMCTHFVVLYGEARGYYAWDALTAAFAINPELISYNDLQVLSLSVNADSTSPSAGRITITKPGDDAPSRGSCTVPRRINPEAFYAMALRCAALI